MSVNRGEIILAYVGYVGSPGGKARPALVVQSDHNNLRLNETIIVPITTHKSTSLESTQLLIDVATPEVLASGLLVDSVVRCERFHSISQSEVRRVIGRLFPLTMGKIDECLKTALGIA